jgi:hypothetical protein
MARIICLANSYKGSGERCVAGIDPDTGRWIRPVPDNKGGAVTSAMRLIDGKEPQILDVIDIPILDSGPDEGCQPENRSLKSGKWNKVGQITAKDLLQYCEDDSIILHNHQEYVPPEFFIELPKSKWRSLQLVHNQEVRFSCAYDPKKWRVLFRDGKGHTLDLKLTDPLISDRLRNNEKISNNCILTISLATPWCPSDGKQPMRCYKMVAGVVEL